MNRWLFLLLSLLFFSSPSFCQEKQSPSSSETVQTMGVAVWATTANRAYEAPLAMDGNTRTMWHSQFSLAPHNDDFPIPISCGYKYGCNDSHPQPAKSDAPSQGIKGELKAGNDPPFPHDFWIDLGHSFEIKGFVYTPRSDGPNGNIADFEFSLADCPDEIDEPVLKGTLTRFDGPQTVLFDSPKKGRFVRFRSLREVNGRPYTSIAELELLCDGFRFFAQGNNVPPGLGPLDRKDGISWYLEIFPRTANEQAAQAVYIDDLIDQYNVLCHDFGKRRFFAAIASEVANEQALILPEDRNPLDVIARRVLALVHELELQEVDRLVDGKMLEEAKKVVVSLTEQRHQIDQKSAKEQFGLFAQLAAIRRVLLFSHSAIDFDKILFVKKHRSEFNHICDQYYGRSAVPGGGLFELSHSFGAVYAPVAKDLLEHSAVQNESRLKGQKLVNGSLLTPDLSFDGKNIAFAWCECLGSKGHVDHLDLDRGHTQEQRCYHLFQCSADGSGLTMVTDGTWNDFDPCFLPNGRVAFTTERRGGYLRCGRDCPNYTLFDMNQDGTQIRCLSYHETNEWNPSVTNDGKIIWTRWDYVDRFGCIAHHPWLTTIDGRDPRAVHGNFSKRHLRADAELDVRAIPNSQKFMATAGPHHGQCYGSIILVDPQVEDDDAMAPVKRLTPNVGFPESQGGSQVWGMPWPLTESLFLAVADYSIQEGVGFQGGATIRGDHGIYLADSLGNLELVYRDPEIGSASPIPFVARSTPPIAPTLIPNSEIVHQPFVVPPADFNAPRPEATITISNVYDSLKPWPNDTKIKAIRVVQVYCMSVPSGAPPHNTGYREPSSLDSVNLARGAWGTVPVEEDGSAHFIVPANCEILFQALDENGAAVQSMRSGTALKEGETLSCTGCHEPRHQAATAPATLPMAFSRPASRLVPEPAGSNPLSYPELVQPILEKHCIACHDKSETAEKGAPNLHREPITKNYFASYNNLLSRGFAFYDYSDPLRTTPGQFGAIHSKLYPMLKAGHHEVKLSSEEMRSVIVWLDLLSNFYGVYEKEGGLRQLRGEKAYPTLE